MQSYEGKGLSLPSQAWLEKYSEVSFGEHTPSFMRKESYLKKIKTVADQGSNRTWRNLPLNLRGLTW